MPDNPDTEGENYDGGAQGLVDYILFVERTATSCSASSHLNECVYGAAAPAAAAAIQTDAQITAAYNALTNRQVEKLEKTY